MCLQQLNLVAPVLSSYVPQPHSISTNLNTGHDFSAQWLMEVQSIFYVSSQVKRLAHLHLLALKAAALHHINSWMVKIDCFLAMQTAIATDGGVCPHYFKVFATLQNSPTKHFANSLYSNVVSNTEFWVKQVAMSIPHSNNCDTHFLLQCQPLAPNCVRGPQRAPTLTSTVYMVISAIRINATVVILDKHVGIFYFLLSLTVFPFRSCLANEAPIWSQTGVTSLYMCSFARFVITFYCCHAAANSLNCHPVLLYLKRCPQSDADGSVRQHCSHSKK